MLYSNVPDCGDYGYNNDFVMEYYYKGIKY